MTERLPATPERLSEAFAARDRSWDGRFVVAVTTTGIYCRPSCPARRPRPENMRFFAAGEQAEAEGFRPCRRCAPDAVARDRAAVELAIALIRDNDGPVALEELGVETGYSPTHLQRIFKRELGLSPAAFGRAIRAERAGEALRDARSVTEALYDAGYGAPSRFYEESGRRLGMAPSAWRNGGRGVRIEWAAVMTSLGRMLVAATDKGICRLSFEEGVAELQARFPAAELAEAGPQLAGLLEKVVQAVEQPGTGADIPLDIRGTAFQERIWQELRKIPPGETRSYAELAAAAGHPKAVRAAGSANGANHVAVLIPCHRVMRSDGSVGGYAYGPAIKAELLRRERK
jgi:AraC family transcriptional regulator of adaptative response/methylated-DNA-[protein]-cysteine methyltransferase